jgi:hypothetical protein
MFIVCAHATAQNGQKAASKPACGAIFCAKWGCIMPFEAIFGASHQVIDPAA